MVRRNGLKATACLFLTGLLCACNGSETEQRSAPQAANCVPLPEGQYLFENGVFLPINAPVANMTETVTPPGSAPERPAASDTGWVDRVEAQFPGMGYGWMDLDIRRGTAILSGIAPDAANKNAGFNAGQAAILADPSAADSINVIVDNISVEGGGAGVGAALASLDENPSLEDCQRAFVETMENRNVEFRTASAVIQPVSARLLDATAGVAIACSAYQIEIGGHTDDIGEDAVNLTLSQDRADAVRNYLIERSVPDNRIRAVGYGETRPLDESGTREANARNRRTEFSVSAR